MTDYPWACGVCERLNMIDLEHMDIQPVNKLVSAQGFCCPCGFFNPVIYTTDSLRVALRKLEVMDVTRLDFPFHLGKVMRKAMGIRAKAELGIGNYE